MRTPDASALPSVSALRPRQYAAQLHERFLAQALLLFLLLLALTVFGLPFLLFHHHSPPSLVLEPRSAAALYTDHLRFLASTFSLAANPPPFGIPTLSMKANSPLPSLSPLLQQEQLLDSLLAQAESSRSLLAQLLPEEQEEGEQEGGERRPVLLKPAVKYTVSVQGQEEDGPSSLSLSLDQFLLFREEEAKKRTEQQAEGARQLEAFHRQLEAWKERVQEEDRIELSTSRENEEALARYQAAVRERLASQRREDAAMYARHETHLKGLADEIGLLEEAMASSKHRQQAKYQQQLPSLLAALFQEALEANPLPSPALPTEQQQEQQQEPQHTFDTLSPQNVLTESMGVRVLRDMTGPFLEPSDMAFVCSVLNSFYALLKSSPTSVNRLCDQYNDPESPLHASKIFSPFVLKASADDPHFPSPAYSLLFSSPMALSSLRIAEPIHSQAPHPTSLPDVVKVTGIVGGRAGARGEYLDYEEVALGTFRLRLAEEVWDEVHASGHFWAWHTLPLQKTAMLTGIKLEFLENRGGRTVFIHPIQGFAA